VHDNAACTKPVNVTRLCFHANVKVQACLLQECDYARVLSDAMRKRQPHIVQHFLGCANLPKQLDLVSCHWTSAIMIKFLSHACTGFV